MWVKRNLLCRTYKLDSIIFWLNAKETVYPVFHILTHFIQWTTFSFPSPSNPLSSLPPRRWWWEEKRWSVTQIVQAIPELTAMLMPQLSKGVKGMSYHAELASNNFLVFSERNTPDWIFNLYSLDIYIPLPKWIFPLLWMYHLETWKHILLTCIQTDKFKICIPGQQNGSWGKGTCHQTRQLEFNSQVPHGGKRKLTLESCTTAHVHTCTQKF